MSKAKVIALAVVHQGPSKAEVARRYGVSWQWVHTLVTRYNESVLDTLKFVLVEGIESAGGSPAEVQRGTPGAPDVSGLREDAARGHQDVSAGHVVRFRRSEPERIVRSRRPAHPEIISVADFTQAQLMRRSKGCGWFAYGS